MTAREVLDGIRGRLTAATPGPWDHEPLNGSFAVYALEQQDNGYYPAVIGYNSEGEIATEADAAFIAAAPTDVARLLAAVEAVLEWCDTNQHPFHPSEGAEGFSSQDWALDDAARRIRTAVEAALKEGE